jgi:hypothetical protein
MNPAMKPIGWLEAHARGFKELSEEEKLAIQHFALLWSLFEGEILNTKASPSAITSVIKNGVANGNMDVTPYGPCLEYFRERYFNNGIETPKFAQLKFKKDHNRELVEQVLRCIKDDPADVISAIFLVVYRLRNNLFHGSKWAYELHDQLENFNHANDILMKAFDQLKHR